ncbi:MAG: hypothetical protein R3A79_21045 [Nannocystaceae bacterium]
MLARRLLLAAALAPLGCERPSETSTASTPVVSHAAAASETTPAAATPEEPAAPRPLIGRWRGASVCLELYTFDEFELSLLSEGPKVTIRGAVERRPAPGEAGELAIVPRQIHRHRWVGPCRKTVVGDAELDSQEVLGSALRKGEAAALRLSPRADGSIELCGERCEVLEPDAPLLSGHWRDAGLERPGSPTTAWAEGALLNLDFKPAHPASTTLWIGLPEARYLTVYGEAAARHVDGERFDLDFTPRMFAAPSGAPPDAMADASPDALGRPIEVGRAVTFSAERLPAGALRICGRDDACAELPRYAPLI